MKKRVPFLTDLIVGTLLVGFFSWAYFSRHTLVETASLKTYDFFLKFRKPPEKSNVIKIVEIDEASLSSLGRWPWPRSVVAGLVDEIVDYGAKVIGVNIFYSEEDKNDGLSELARLHDAFKNVLAQEKRSQKKKHVEWVKFDEFLQDLDQTQEDLNGDDILARSIDEAGNVILPLEFIPGAPRGENLEALPKFLEKEKFSGVDKSHLQKSPVARAAVAPLEIFGKPALAVGHANLVQDLDGGIRRIPPAFRYGDDLYPSFALQIVKGYKNLQSDALLVNPKGGYSLRTFDIPVDSEGQTFIDFVGPFGTFEHYSALDILSRGISEENLKNKIVLVGVTAPGLQPMYVVPSGENFTGLELWANHIDNILNQRFIRQPGWAKWAEWSFILLAGLVVLVLPFMRARISVPVASLVFALMGASSFFLFVKKGLWVTPAYGVVLLVSGFVVLAARRLLFTERGKEMVEAEGMETNKMLGLSFQGQGMLDLAFEKFRKCPMDNTIKDLLYNLGLDMERKRMFSKAAAVYEHIGNVDAGYKDIKDKIELLKKAGQGAVFGSVGKKGSDATVVVDGLGQNTTLGRYEVVRELGRGAMGIVYLGKDPKINRQVAIKTLRFEDEVDDAQAKTIKERFFREAESAGNLTHPNIIRIFDAGEDQDVAYIAMELIEGSDLKGYCDKSNLLPIERVLDYVAHIADALAFAHKQGVVHRDIKPANIMLLKDGTLRITDFGIARIQATSKTATGAVLGTPAYMSPEQINGQKVDGRADIFSLGVMFFELLTGEKPFAADSIAALLYRIANVDHPDPREYNPKVPAEVVPIINKALAKDARERYQVATEMALDIKDCLNKLEGRGNAPSAPPPTSEATKTVAIETPVIPAAPIIEPTAHAQTESTKTQTPDSASTKNDSFLSELQDVLETRGKQDPIIEPTAHPHEATQTEILTSKANLKDFFSNPSGISPTEVGEEPKNQKPTPDGTVVLPTMENMFSDGIKPEEEGEDRKSA